MTERNKRRLLRRVGASEYLLEVHAVSRTPQTLAKQAVQGDGPPFRKSGRFPMYDPDDLDTYAESLLSPLVTSTAELKSLQAAANG